MWNFTIEQALPAALILRSTYQGSAGRRLFHAAELNPAQYGPGATRANTDQRRPRTEFTQITFAGTYGRSNYYALVLSVERRFSAGLSFLLGYSWRKSMDLLSNTAFEGNGNTHPYDSIDQDYAVSNFHRGDLFTDLQLRASGLISKRSLRHILGGWRTNGIVTLQTGAPLTVFNGVDNSFTGIGQDRVDIIGDPHRQDHHVVSHCAFGSPPRAHSAIWDGTRSVDPDKPM